MIVALIDDDEAILHSLRLLLEGRGMTVDCFSSAASFLAALGTRAPNCVVSDVRMPGLSGLELQAELKKRDSTVPVILITGHGDISMAVDAIKAGAFDFLEKPFDDEHLVASITAAVERGQKLRLEQSERTDLETRIAELSPRQREIMDLVVQGYANKEIALRLDISPRTVENYRAWVMEKMGARNLADLVRKAMSLESGRSSG
jgi:two-component system, LuxR family, response regulator FixJ